MTHGSSDRMFSSVTSSTARPPRPSLEVEPKSPRSLRPSCCSRSTGGGLEHGLAPDDAVQRWQHRLEPVQNRVFGGCHLTRRITDLLEDAGFTLIATDV